MSKGGPVCILRPTAKMRSRLGVLGTPREVAAMVEDATAVDALARLLTEQIEKHAKPGGAVDMRDVAAAVLAEMGRHQK